MPNRTTAPMLGAVLATRLREVRKQRGLDQADLARRLRELGFESATQSMVSKFEKPDGSRAKNMSVHHLFAFAMALNVAPVDLLTPSALADRVQLPCGHITLSGQVRGWVRGNWPLRDTDDRWDFFAAAAPEERATRLAQRERREPGEPMPATEAYLLPEPESGGE